MMRVTLGWRTAVAAGLLLAGRAAAVDIDFSSEASIKGGASTIAYGLMKFYTGNNTGDTPGNLPDPYFWWEAGGMFGHMVDYWAMTGDSTYNDVTMQALVHQAGPDIDFMPENQTLTEGNDDQGFWAMAAMTAAERKFPDPPSDQPQYLALAQSVVNQYAARWDTTTCGGGLRWQIFNFNVGFDYKNSISNGCFFNLAARLARYTGNATYADWAERVWDWEAAVGLIGPDLSVHDGSSVAKEANCTGVDGTQWSYNAGVYLHGAATMYNYTGSDVWKNRTVTILQTTLKTFLAPPAAPAAGGSSGGGGVLFEQYCEPSAVCDNDQLSFKGYLIRWLASAYQLAPFLADTIMPVMTTTSAAAAKSCVGSSQYFRGMQGTACGFRWTVGGFDGLAGVGQQMNALSAVMYTLVSAAAAPVTATTGGTSVGDPSGGGADKSQIGQLTPVSNGDRAGAGILTMLILAGVLGGSWFVVSE